MFQSMMFGGTAVKVGNAGGYRQAALPFKGSAESGRRGEMGAGWLDAVLATLRRSGSDVPTLGELQAEWDGGRSCHDAADSILASRATVKMGKITRQLATDLNTDFNTPMGPLPGDIRYWWAARQVERNGLPIDAAADRTGLSRGQIVTFLDRSDR